MGRHNDLLQQVVKKVELVAEDAVYLEKVSPGLGEINVLLVVTKVMQHTFERQDALLKNALNRDRALIWLDQ